MEIKYSDKYGQKYKIIDNYAVVCKNKVSENICVPRYLEVNNIKFKVRFPKISKGLFENNGRLKTFSVEYGVDTSSIITVERMFCNCVSLVDVNLSAFDTSNVDNMREMFENCASLVEVKLNSFDTFGVLNMSGMFKHCVSLVEVGLDTFYIGENCIVTKMFSYCSCLKSIRIYCFQIPVNEMYCKDMICSCKELRKVVVKCGRGGVGGGVGDRRKAIEIISGCNKLKCFKIYYFNLSSKNKFYYNFMEGMFFS